PVDRNLVAVDGDLEVLLRVERDEVVEEQPLERVAGPVGTADHRRGEERLEAQRLAGAVSLGGVLLDDEEVLQALRGGSVEEELRAALRASQRGLAVRHPEEWHDRNAHEQFLL